jgi:hypothetical protein
MSTPLQSTHATLSEPTKMDKKETEDRLSWYVSTLKFDKVEVLKDNPMSVIDHLAEFLNTKIAIRQILLISEDKNDDDMEDDILIKSCRFQIQSQNKYSIEVETHTKVDPQKLDQISNWSLIWVHPDTQEETHLLKICTSLQNQNQNQKPKSTTTTNVDLETEFFGTLHLYDIKNKRVVQFNLCDDVKTTYPDRIDHTPTPIASKKTKTNNQPKQRTNQKCKVRFNANNKSAPSTPSTVTTSNKSILSNKNETLKPNTVTSPSSSRAQFYIQFDYMSFLF